MLVEYLAYWQTHRLRLEEEDLQTNRFIFQTFLNAGHDREKRHLSAI